MTRIFVVDDSAFNLKIVSATLAPAGYEIVTANGGTEALERVDAIQPDLIILDVMMPDLNGYEVCRRLRRKSNMVNRPIMMLTANDSLEERINGLEVGADDYMSKPFEAAELQARVKALLRRFAPAALETATHGRQGKVVAAFSLRGGIGVSTVAANVAVGLAQIWGQPTALVDLALTNGQSALMLNLPLRNSWADLAPAAASELITAEKVGHVIALLKDRYEYVVLDLPHDFSETTLAGLDHADQIITVMAPELASIRAMASTLDVFEHLGYERNRVSMVLNSTFERGALARKDIESTLKQQMTIVLPFAPEPVIGSINRGLPVVI